MVPHDDGPPIAGADGCKAISDGTARDGAKIERFAAQTKAEVV
jgi:hypothetical protein